MARNPQERVQWAVRKSQEFLDSAIENIEADRTYPAAEGIFRSVESSLTALLYNEGVVDIEYPRYGGDNLTGRSALQPLIREKLLNPGIISNEDYQTYRHFVSDLHLRGYIPGETFEESELKEYSEYAEGLLIKARSVLPDPT